ncbi:MAG TPA: asparagine synthase-related protein [Candidatus Woesebacteria bacterium]|nr:asparagine synthase-related protein [Candidatus Woesebacteria bacterium]
MCGIAGFTGSKDEKLIKQMSADMKHRGPNGDGFFFDGNISLLNRRLSIIDRKGGDQPIYNEDKSIVVVYNGEIYNYLELRNELETLGHTFRTKSDTEVIVHSYEEWGDMCFDKFNGMFGIALYDKKKERLVLARDHFGIKPLYFAKISSERDAELDSASSDVILSASEESRRDPSSTKKRTQDDLKVIFSSEIKPILNSRLVEKKVNERILYRYLQFRVHDDQRETFFKGIERLLPGEMAIIEKNEITFKTFSSLNADLETFASIEATQLVDDFSIRTFKQLLTDSIKARLVSEVPVGTALSGGLDSSAIVATINNLLKEHASVADSIGTKQNTFSAIFPGAINDEEQYIKTLLEQSEQITSHKIYPKPEEFFADLEDFVRTQEEPIISTGTYSQYQVMKKAQEHVTVLLDGQGADEMIAGYLPYYFVYLKQLQKRGHWITLISEICSSQDVLIKFGWIKLLQKLSINKSVPVSSVLNQHFSNKFNKERFFVISDNLKKRLQEDIFKNSLPSLLRYEDRNTMRFSLEGRVPFLDINLVRYLFSLSDKAIIKNGWNKYILRKAVADLLPEKIYKRRNKIGFTTPEQEWFLRMKNRIYGIFMSESFMNRPYFNQPEVVKAFREFVEGKNDDTLLFWRLLNVEMWLREFFDEKKELKPEKQWQFGNANEGKQIEIKVEDKEYKRYPIKTDLVEKGTDIKEFITKYINQVVNQLSLRGSKTTEAISRDHFAYARDDKDKKWYVIVSEKIVAISQGRSFFIWDIKPGFWAKQLSKFVTRTPYGIGLGSPWTMQIAIDEVGLPHILAAAIGSVVTKPFGIKGVFYKVVGPEIAAIDGPTEYSVYPSNVSAKLAPKNPQKVAEEIGQSINQLVNQSVIAIPTSREKLSQKGIATSSTTPRNDNDMIESFGGVVIIDANDLGRNVLGNATEMPDSFFEDVMRDNPMGQGSEQTPIVILT